jgi:6-phosphofructokinase 1
MNKISKIGVFTSGGDAPGMNAAIRAVVRTAAYHNMVTIGISRGYEGMISARFQNLQKSDVSNIIHRGGTVLKTARSEEFKSKEGRSKAFENLKKQGIEALIAIGGDGTFTGAKILAEEYSIPIIGVPGTIDNDLYGTDYSIGFDTAVNTAVDAVDKIRDTADSHNRVFFIEVMGRHSGYIALYTAIASGAGALIIPEKEETLEGLVDKLKNAAKRSKLFSLVIVAEGSQLGSADQIAKQIASRFRNFETRVAVIGHLQRGGSPTANDRVLASRMGNAAIEGLLAGKSGVMAGIINDEVVYTSFSEAIQKKKMPDTELIKMAEILSL